MTNLTEQWKKGELPSGWYYVKLIRGEYRTDLYIKDKNEWIDCPDKIISEVLAEVPSYEEWQTAKKMIAQSIGVCDENSKLKELLKKVLSESNIRKESKVATNKDYDTFYTLLMEIDQVIGEE